MNKKLSITTHLYCTLLAILFALHPLPTHAQTTFGDEQIIIQSNARSASDVYAADLDGDGYKDILSASAADNKIAWYKNNGNGNFGAQQIITTDAYGVYSIYATDFG